MTHRKCALITGASSGIGKELTYLFARDGYSLILTALNHKKVEGFGMQINEEYKVPVEIVSADLSQQDGPQKIYDAAKKRNLTIDVLVNNAGIGMYGDFKDVEMEEYSRIINVNIVSFTHLAKLFMPDIIQQKGKILNTASVASFQPGPHMSVYYASKAYDLSLSLALAEELQQYGVTVTALCPGPTVTNFQKRAKQEKTRAFQNKMLTMNPRSVAIEGYEAMKQGKRIAVAGAKNKLSMQLERLMSHKAVTKMSQMYLTETGRVVMDKEKERELHNRAGEIDQELKSHGDGSTHARGSTIEHTQQPSETKGDASPILPSQRGSAREQIDSQLEEDFQSEMQSDDPSDTFGNPTDPTEINKTEASDRDQMESQIEEEFQADMQTDESINHEIKDPIEPPEWTDSDQKPESKDRRQEMESRLEKQVDGHIGEGMEHKEPIRDAGKKGKTDSSNKSKKGRR